MKKEAKYTEEDYHKNYYSGLSGKLMRQNHVILEKFNFGYTEKILEIGGGFHPHINFVKSDFKEYYCLDIETAENVKEYINKNYKDIIFDYYDGKKIPFNDNYFDRIVISHCLEHILEPEKFTYEMMRVLKKEELYLWPYHVTRVYSIDLVDLFSKWLWKKDLLIMTTITTRLVSM